MKTHQQAQNDDTSPLAIDLRLDANRHNERMSIQFCYD